MFHSKNSEASFNHLCRDIGNQKHTHSAAAYHTALVVYVLSVLCMGLVFHLFGLCILASSRQRAGRKENDKSPPRRVPSLVKGSLSGAAFSTESACFSCSLPTEFTEYLARGVLLNSTYYFIAGRKYGVYCVRSRQMSYVETSIIEWYASPVGVEGLFPRKGSP